jgi:hypothetical protein
MIILFSNLPLFARREKIFQMISINGWIFLTASMTSMALTLLKDS